MLRTRYFRNGCTVVPGSSRLADHTRQLVVFVIDAVAREYAHPLEKVTAEKMGHFDAPVEPACQPVQALDSRRVLVHLGARTVTAVNGRHGALR